MKKVGDILVAGGIFLFLYSTLGRFIAGPEIGMNILKASAASGLVMANSVMLVGIIVKLFWSK